MFDDIPRPTCRSVYTVSDKHLRHGGSGYETTLRVVYRYSPEEAPAHLLIVTLCDVLSLAPGDCTIRHRTNPTSVATKVCVWCV